MAIFTEQLCYPPTLIYLLTLIIFPIKELKQLLKICLDKSLAK